MMRRVGAVNLLLTAGLVAIVIIVLSVLLTQQPSRLKLTIKLLRLVHIELESSNSPP